MSEKLGLVSLEGPRTPLFLPVPMQNAREYSDDTARLIDSEIKAVLTDAHEKVKAILASHGAALEELAQLLLQKEVVERPELQAILKVVSIEEVREKKERDIARAVGTAGECKNGLT
jgi:cell division protease FtsH